MDASSLGGRAMCCGAFSDPTPPDSPESRVHGRSSKSRPSRHSLDAMWRPGALRTGALPRAAPCATSGRLRRSARDACSGRTPGALALPGAGFCFAWAKREPGHRAPRRSKLVRSGRLRQPARTLAPRLYEGGRVVNGRLALWWLGPSCGVVGGSGAHLSIAPSMWGLGVMGGRLRGRNSKRAVRRPDEKRRLPQRESGQRAGCG
jgi:hypothetical protein